MQNTTTNVSLQAFQVLEVVLLNANNALSKITNVGFLNVPFYTYQKALEPKCLREELFLGPKGNNHDC